MKFKSSDTFNQRIERITPAHLVVGIDIAKEVHVAGAVNFRGKQLGQTVSFSNNYIGFEKLMKWVHDLKKTNALTEVIFGAESTGHYFFNLAHWLHNRKELVVLVNPMTTKRNKENRDHKPSKSDAKDAIIIADSVSRGYYHDWVIHEPAYLKMRCMVNEREALSIDLVAVGNQLQNVLDHVFPEFTCVFKEWNCPTGLATLKAFPLPADLKGLTADQIIDGWRKMGMQRCGGSRGKQRATLLIHTACRSVGLTGTALEMKRQIGRLLERYEAIQKQITTVDQEIREVLLQFPSSVRHPFEEIGLSPWLMAVILANAGNLENYQHGKQLLALAGLNLAENTSGKRKGQVGLSKRGRRQLRKYLYLAVLGLVANNEAFKRWHAYNVNTLKIKKQKSLFKLIGKLSRILVALAHNQEVFHEDKANALLSRAA